MSQNKHAYFQGGGGVNEPTPKKKKYKSEPALVMQTRFKEPFYRNYDLYNVPGKHGPGAGWHDMGKYDSISDFLKSKRKKLKDKYKADDSWIQDDGSHTKTPQNGSIKKRMSLLSAIVKYGIDFPIDDQIKSDPILGHSSPGSDAAPIGGKLDEYLPLPDFEGKSADKLNFGRDYADCSDADILYNEGRDSYYCNQCGKRGFNGPYKPKPTVQELHSGKDYTLDDNLDKLEAKYLKPSEPPLYGLPDGIFPQEDLDAPSNEDPRYGITDSGNTLYEKMWI